MQTIQAQESSVPIKESQRLSAINRPSFTLSFTSPTFKMLSLQNAIMRAKNSTEVDNNLRTSMHQELGQVCRSTLPTHFALIY